MAKFEETATSRNDHFFVDEDGARVYRGLKDLLVDEFDIDRIEEGKNEFNVADPEDDIALHAFKEKSPNTLIHYELDWVSRDPKTIYKWERHDEILEASLKTTAEIVTVFPGRTTSEWDVERITEKPIERKPNTFLRRERRTRFQKTKLYDVMAGFWYHYLYHGEIERYKEEARQTVKRIHNVMRERFGVDEAIGRTDRSQYQPPW